MLVKWLAPWCSGQGDAPRVDLVLGEAVSVLGERGPGQERRGSPMRRRPVRDVHPVVDESPVEV